MKKSAWIFIIGILALVGVGYWLLRGANADHVQRQEVIIDVADTFEK